MDVFDPETVASAGIQKMEDYFQYTPLHLLPKARWEYNDIKLDFICCFTRTA
jgi:hypothetical protein